MNNIATANLALSTRLQELAPGWGDTSFFHVADMPYAQPRYGRQGYVNTIIAPDLDWLLNRLPPELDRRILIVVTGDRPYVGYAERDNYGNYCLDDYFYSHAQYASETCDAACALLIKLIETKIIEV